MALPAWRLWCNALDARQQGNPQCDGPEALIQSIEIATAYDNDGEVTQLNRAQRDACEACYHAACKRIGTANPSTAALKKYFKAPFPPGSPSVLIIWRLIKMLIARRARAGRHSNSR